MRPPVLGCGGNRLIALLPRCSAVRMQQNARTVSNNKNEVFHSIHQCCLCLHHSIRLFTVIRFLHKCLCASHLRIRIDTIRGRVYWAQWLWCDWQKCVLLCACAHRQVGVDNKRRRHCTCCAHETCPFRMLLLACYTSTHTHTQQKITYF